MGDNPVRSDDMEELKGRLNELQTKIENLRGRL
jgi:tetrahydromethanopterin S-methyltransferase subunit G